MSESKPKTATAADPDLDEVARMWGHGWQRFLFPAFWLVYLGQTANGVAEHSHGAAMIVGYLVLVLFAACYVAALPMGWNGGQQLFWPMYGLCFVLTAIEAAFAHQDALVCLVYIAVLTLATRQRWAGAMVLALTLTVGLLPLVVPSWGGAFNWDGALTLFVIAFAMFGFFKIIQSNLALAAAHAEVARLAAENERSRIARDLHDLLGHSLTTITVKAGLARRLAERGEAARAFAEIGEVEGLSRRTLGDVRAAVAGHRDVTLAGELATAREVLRATGIVAELPASVDTVAPELSELFGWVVREGVTNIVRHSRAEHCRIVLKPRCIEIVDDGHGGPAGPGNGLAGLRERVASQGGTLTARGGLNGFALRAYVPGAAERADANGTGSMDAIEPDGLAGAERESERRRCPMRRPDGESPATPAVSPSRDGAGVGERRR